jgi:hypothetical protein
VRVLHLERSRSAIPRIDKGRRSLGGQVAQDPIISGFRCSAFGDVGVACTSKSRVAISRVNGSR